MKYQASFCVKLDIFTRENNMLSSHVKISALLWLHNNRTFQTKNFLSKMVWHFIGVYIINRILHGLLEIRSFSSRVEKYFTSKRSEGVKYFFKTSREISYLRAPM